MRLRRRRSRRSRKRRSRRRSRRKRRRRRRRKKRKKKKEANLLAICRVDASTSKEAIQNAFIAHIPKNRLCIYI